MAASELLVIRHCQAESNSAVADIDRELTARGVRQAEWLAAELLKRLERLEVPTERVGIYTSPAARCDQTAQILGRAVSVEPEVASWLSRGSGPEAFWSGVEDDALAFRLGVLVTHGEVIRALPTKSFDQRAMAVWLRCTPRKYQGCGFGVRADGSCTPITPAFGPISTLKQRRHGEAR